MGDIHLIYKTTNLINGKSYIGQTVIGLKKRWKQHLKETDIRIKQYGETQKVTKLNKKELQLI